MAAATYDDLADFSLGSFTYQNATKPIYRKGRGPGVVIMHEIPGITPQVADFARRVADAGFTSVMPVLFGTPGKPMTTGYALGQMVRACISSDQELAVVKERSAAGCTVLGLRFAEDQVVPADRFATLRRELGDGFIGIEIDSSPDNPHGISSGAHSVLTTDYKDAVGHPTHDALNKC